MRPAIHFFSSCNLKYFLPVFFMFFLSGCGNKAALYLPENEKTSEDAAKTKADVLIQGRKNTQSSSTQTP